MHEGYSNNDDYSDELDSIRERRRQREAYREEYGEDEETFTQWWLPLLFKQFLVVVVIVGFVFAVKAVSSDGYGKLRGEYAKYMSAKMEWAEIFSQIGNAARYVFAVAESTQAVGEDENTDKTSSPDVSTDKNDTGETETIEEETSQSNVEESNASESSSEADVDEEETTALPTGGATLSESNGLSFSPLWVSASAVLPVTGRKSSGFGLRENPINGGLGWHSGLDIAAAAGSKILAAYSGSVEKVGYDNVSGNYILLNHGGGFKSFYCHASEILAQEGQEVNAGEGIALVGSTGESTGPHLHVELRLNGLSYDPEPLFSDL